MCQQQLKASVTLLACHVSPGSTGSAWQTQDKQIKLCLVNMRDAIQTHWQRTCFFARYTNYFATRLKQEKRQNVYVDQSLLTEIPLFLLYESLQGSYFWNFFVCLFAFDNFFCSSRQVKYEIWENSYCEGTSYTGTCYNVKSTVFSIKHAHPQNRRHCKSCRELLPKRFVEIRVNNPDLGQKWQKACFYERKTQILCIYRFIVSDLLSLNFWGKVSVLLTIRFYGSVEKSVSRVYHLCENISVDTLENHEYLHRKDEQSKGIFGWNSGPTPLWQNILHLEAGGLRNLNFSAYKKSR